MKGAGQWPEGSPIVVCGGGGGGGIVWCAVVSKEARFPVFVCQTCGRNRGEGNWVVRQPCANPRTTPHRPPESPILPPSHPPPAPNLTKRPPKETPRVFWLQ